MPIEPIFMEQARAIVKGGEALPSIETLARRLQQAAETQTPLRVKLGFDPTRPDLHLGHAVVLKKLRLFQDLGHQAVLLIGDATAMIGDPSGKSETRPALQDAEVQANAQTYLDQAGKILNIDKAEIVRNSDWFKDMNLGSFLKLSAKATIAQILERDDFNKRYTEGRPIYMHELFYPLMQGYDSVVIDSDIELGGSDQRFNNLMGRELQQAYWRDDADKSTKPSQLVILAPILEGTDGVVKMSKSYPEHCINLTDTPADFYGKIMSISDAMIPRYEVLLTPMNEEQIKQQEHLMTVPVSEGGMNPRDVKANMAKWLVGEFFGQDEAQKAEEQFINQFRNKKIPDDIPETDCVAGTEHKVLELIVANGLAPSKSEARRLFASGAVKQDGEKFTDESAIISGEAGTETVIQVGKRRYLKVTFG
jgi:tyrosyl-tRNA synthetase